MKTKNSYLNVCQTQQKTVKLSNCTEKLLIDKRKGKIIEIYKNRVDGEKLPLMTTPRTQRSDSDGDD